MTTFRDRIEILIDVMSDGGPKELQKWRQELNDADGAVGKFKAGAGGAFAYVKANAATMAAGAGAAIAGFAAHSIAKFQGLALEVGVFSDSLKMSAETGSRWLDVTKRYGIELGDLQDVFNNVAGKVDEGAAVFDELGVVIARGADGNVDMAETMTRVIEQMGKVEDPAKRARIAAELFGEEGSRQFAELIEQGDTFRDLLEDVSGSKLIDEQEIAKARRFRETMQELNGAWQSFVIGVGEGAVSVIQSFQEMFSEAERIGRDFRRAIDEEADANWSRVDSYNAAQRAAAEFDRTQLEGLTTFQEVHDAVTQATGDVEAANVVALEWNETTGEQIRQQKAHVAALQDVRMQTDGLRAEMTDAERATARQEATERRAAAAAEAHAEKIENVTAAYKRQSDRLSDRSAYLDVEDAFAALGETAGKTMRDIERDQIAAKNAVITYAEEIGNVPPHIATSIQTLIDRGQYEDALAKLRELERERTTNVRVVIGGGDGGGTGYSGRRAAGGPVTAGRYAEVAEGGRPEVFTDDRGRTYLVGSGRVTPLDSMEESTGAGSSSVTVMQILPAGTRIDDLLVAAQRRRSRRNGWIPS